MIFNLSPVGDRGLGSCASGVSLISGFPFISGVVLVSSMLMLDGRGFFPLSLESDGAGGGGQECGSEEFHCLLQIGFVLLS